MATVKKVLILVVPVIVWGVLYGLGCQKKEDTEKPQKEQLTPIRPSMDEPASLGNKQIPSDMEGKFPKEMLRALQKSGHEGVDSLREKEGRAPVSVVNKQIPSDMEGKFPKEMLKALQKSAHEGVDSPREKKGRVPVSVSPDVHNKWKSVVIEVDDKQTGEQKDYVVDINKGFIIPNSKISISVLTFLPDFSMSSKEITSLSNEPRNPAVKVVVHEDGNKIYEGWLFQKLPTVHPFEHKAYAIKLKGQKSA